MIGRMPAGYTFVKMIDQKVIKEGSFEYRMEEVSVIKDNLGNYYIKRYTNTCYSGANGRPCCTEKDEAWKITEEAMFNKNPRFLVDYETLTAENWHSWMPSLNYFDPDITFLQKSGNYVDQGMLNKVNNF